LLRWAGCGYANEQDGTLFTINVGISSNQTINVKKGGTSHRLIGIRSSTPPLRHAFQDRRHRWPSVPGRSSDQAVNIAPGGRYDIDS
jgi:hypothetical protein